MLFDKSKCFNVHVLRGLWAVVSDRQAQKSPGSLYKNTRLNYS